MVTSHAKYHNVSVENMSFTVINSPRLIYNKEHISSISRDAYGILDKDVLASLSCVLEFSTECDMDSSEGYNASGFRRAGIHTFSRRLFIVIYLSNHFLPVVRCTFLPRFSRAVVNSFNLQMVKYFGKVL